MGLPLQGLVAGRCLGIGPASSRPRRRQVNSAMWRQCRCRTQFSAAATSARHGIWQRSRSCWHLVLAFGLRGLFFAGAGGGGRGGGGAAGGGWWVGFEFGVEEMGLAQLHCTRFVHTGEWLEDLGGANSVSCRRLSSRHRCDCARPQIHVQVCVSFPFASFLWPWMSREYKMTEAAGLHVGPLRPCGLKGLGHTTRFGCNVV